MEPPDRSERGFKDTVKANPGYFTTIRAKFDLPTGVTAPQNYVSTANRRARGQRHDAAVHGHPVATVARLHSGVADPPA
jgi:hypothetical protein